MTTGHLLNYVSVAALHNVVAINTARHLCYLLSVITVYAVFVTVIVRQWSVIEIFHSGVSSIECSLFSMSRSQSANCRRSHSGLVSQPTSSSQYLHSVLALLQLCDWRLLGLLIHWLKPLHL